MLFNALRRLWDKCHFLILFLILSVVLLVYSLKKQELRQATQSAKAKLEIIKHTGKQDLDITDAEWESLSLQTQNNSWKDEWVTIIITIPIPMILFGAIWYVYTGDISLLDGIILGLDKLKALGVDMGFLMKAVVLAAIGIKVWRA